MEDVLSAVVVEVQNPQDYPDRLYQFLLLFEVLAQKSVKELGHHRLQCSCVLVILELGDFFLQTPDIGPQRFILRLQLLRLIILAISVLEIEILANA